MPIADWIFKVAETPQVNFVDKTYDALLKKYHEGSLDETDASAVEEIEYLRDLINVAVSKLVNKVPEKEAATKALPELPAEDSKTPASEKEPTPGVPPPLPSGAAAPERKKLPGKGPSQEPETTKWKEIRFNKKDDAWQVITTVRSTRNYRTEEEALEFAKRI